MVKLAVIFDNLGPYHVARLEALALLGDVVAIELHEISQEYAWRNVKKGSFEQHTVLKQGEAPTKLVKELWATLELTKPDAIFFPGWSSQGALAANFWALRKGIPSFVMSDTQESDATRRGVVEWVKRSILRHVAGALVAGSPHRSYAQSLGFSGAAIREGYDVVDNRFFAEKVQAARAEARTKEIAISHPKYFLASARFVEKKNLLRLLEAFALYRQSSSRERHWDLVILGDGPLKPLLVKYVHSLGLQSSVHMPGFLQVDQLPSHYANASAFILPSVTEQWGLVVNEAMASGLPVLVSNRCGCASDLVSEGVNGRTFDPMDVTAISDVMILTSSTSEEELSRMGHASETIISKWTPARFARSAIELAESAEKPLVVRPRLLDLTILYFLLLNSRIGTR